MMRAILRPLLPAIMCVLFLTATLVLWIRLEPLQPTRPVQVLLSILLVLASVVLGAVVLSVEHDAAPPEHTDAWMTASDHESYRAVIQAPGAQEGGY